MNEKQTKISVSKPKEMIFIPLEETRLQLGDQVRKDKDGNVIVARYKD